MDVGVMEKKLHDACMEGDVKILEVLIREDKLTLARISLSSSYKQTPLHLVCMLGRFDFAKSLLSYKSDFVKKTDLQGRSPLHLACANGYVNIVQLLLDHDVKMCQHPDEEGRTPLHLVVLNGEHEIITELIKFNIDNEGSILHLCILYNRLDILIIVLEQSNDRDLSNKKDDKGNTILHSATALGRTKIIKYLVKRSDVDLNLLNENGLTTLQIVEEMPNDTKTMKINDLLILAENEDVDHPENEDVDHPENEDVDHPVNKVADYNRIQLEKKVPIYLKLGRKWSTSTIFQRRGDKNEDSILIAATVIAAMTYQAAISPGWYYFCGCRIKK